MLPSEQVTKPVTVTTKDNNGRSIELRKLTAFDRMRFFQIIGGDNASNPGYMGIAIFAYAVVAIDGVAQPVPGTRVALEALVKLLDDDGVNAAAAAFSKHFMPKDEETDDERRATLKNE